MSNGISSATASAAPAVVLVVDDEAVVRMVAIDLFEELGCEVLEAASGAEALALLEERSDVTLLFTDCRMPEMSGIELAKQAAIRWPQLKIILLTGYENLRVPRWPTVRKPFDAQMLERAMNEAARPVPAAAV